MESVDFAEPVAVALTLSRRVLCHAPGRGWCSGTATVSHSPSLGIVARFGHRGTGPAGAEQHSAGEVLEASSCLPGDFCLLGAAGRSFLCTRARLGPFPGCSLPCHASWGREKPFLIPSFSTAAKEEKVPRTDPGSIQEPGPTPGLQQPLGAGGSSPKPGPWSHRSHGKGGSSTPPAPLPALCPHSLTFLIHSPRPLLPPPFLPLWGEPKAPTPDSCGSWAFPAPALGQVLHPRTPK